MNVELTVHLRSFKIQHTSFKICAQCSVRTAAYNRYYHTLQIPACPIQNYQCRIQAQLCLLAATKAHLPHQH